MSDSSIYNSGDPSNMADSRAQESRTTHEPRTLHPPPSSPTASPTASGASPPTPCSNSNPICRLHALAQHLQARTDRLNSWPATSPGASRAPSPTPSCKHDALRQVPAAKQRSLAALREAQEMVRQFELRLLRIRECRLNEREGHLKLERRRLRQNDLWYQYGELKAFIGEQIWRVAVEKRSLQQEIKQVEDAAEDI